MTAQFRLGIVHPMAFPDAGGDLGALKASVGAVVGDLDFDVIELMPVASPVWRREIVSMLESARVEVVVAAQPVIFGEKLDLSASSVEARSAAVDRLKAIADVAVEMGAARLAVVSGPAVGHEEHAAAVARLVDSLTRVARHASEAGVSTVLEAFDSGIDKRRLIGANAEAARVADEVRAAVPGFGLMLDLSHLPLQGETIEGALRDVRGRLAHVHIGNCVLEPRDDAAFGDQHPRFGYGAGCNDVKEVAAFLRLLREVAYIGPGGDNIISFEVKPRPGEDPVALISGSKRTLRHAMAQVMASH